MAGLSQEILSEKKNPSSAGLSHLFFQMLKIGAISWGGFMALISVVQKQFAEKNRLIDNEVVLDGIALASVLPGPVAFNVVTFVGYKVKGLKGAFLAMTGILLPSFILMMILSYFYFRYGNIPAITSFFEGVYPAIAAIILAVAINMSKKNIKDPSQIFIALASFVLLVLIKSFFITLAVIVAGGVLGLVIYGKREENDEQTDSGGKENTKDHVYLILAGIVVLITIFVFLVPYFCTGAAKEQCLLQQKIAMIFSGLSLSLFGGGYVVIPVLEHVFVHQLEWLSLKEFADGIALGQITPGPIFISATFIGYKTGGVVGALNATLFIFLPPALLMILASHFLDRIKHSRVIKAVFKGLRPAVIGMIFSAVVSIARGAEAEWLSLVFFIITLFLIMYLKMNAVYLIPLAGIAGIIFF